MNRSSSSEFSGSPGRSYTWALLSGPLGSHSTGHSPERRSDALVAPMEIFDLRAIVEFGSSPDGSIGGASVPELGSAIDLACSTSTTTWQRGQKDDLTAKSGGFLMDFSMANPHRQRPTGDDPSATTPPGSQQNKTKQNQNKQNKTKQNKTKQNNTKQRLRATPLLNTVSRARGKGWHSQPAASVALLE